MTNFKKTDGTKFEDMGEDFYYHGASVAHIAPPTGPEVVCGPIKGSLSEDKKTINVLFRIDPYSRLNSLDEQHLKEGSKLTVFVQYLVLAVGGENKVQGPWIIELTLPPDNVMKEYDLNETTVTIDTEKATFLSVRMSPVLFIFRARGDLDLIYSAMHYLKYEKQDGTVSQVNGICCGYKKISDMEYEMTFTLSEPMNIDEIKSLIFIGKHAKLS
jgi:hypothetical protein